MVIYSGNTIKGYGNLIILRHSEEFVTVYAHNQVNLVEEGSGWRRGRSLERWVRREGPQALISISKSEKITKQLIHYCF